MNIAFIQFILICVAVYLPLIQSVAYADQKEQTTVTYTSYCDIQQSDVECVTREIQFMMANGRMPVTDGEIADIYNDPNPLDETPIQTGTFHIPKQTACELQAQGNDTEFWETINGQTVPLRCGDWQASGTILDADY